MRRLLLALVAVVLLASQLFAGDQYVQGYTRSNGTYVSGYHRSTPNSTVVDNYSYKGNTNPFTGATGTNYNRNSPSSQYYGTSSTRSSGTSSYGSYGD